MRRLVCKTKRMMTVSLLLFSIALLQVKAQEATPIVLDLEKALEIAMSENPTVKVADQEIEKKQYAKKGAYAALFPQINFSADYSRTLKKQVMYMDGAFDMGSMLDPVVEPIVTGIDRTLQGMDPNYVPGTLGTNIAGSQPPPVETTGGNEGISVGRDNNWSFGFSLGIPLVNASLWKSLSISGMDVELAIEQARSSKIDMTNQVTKAFYAVMLANDSYRVFKDSYENAMSNYLDIKNKYEQGQVAEYDLIRADVSVKNIEPNMLQAENAVTLAKWQLKALLGMDLDMPIECEGKLTDYQSNLYGEHLLADYSLGENTSLRQLDLQKGQLEKTLTLQKFDFLPTLSLSGVYNWSAMNNDFKFSEYRWNPYSMVGLSLSIPIFSGGSRVQKINQTKATLFQMDLQRSDMERNLQLAVKQYQDNMNTCIKRFDAARKGVEQSERGFEIAQKRYETGAGTLLERNDAELAMTQAKLNFNQSIYDYMVSKSDLDRIIGKYNDKIRK
ncbi:TolC family protein [Parabacteroides sp. OttesenSCG-928-G07]|nr:TolC family protein [Parabacteroides sp. OttesenSCG-928-G21]MDL2277552.1 TolC family protein [Parabacteroides sp. OttesenSCG-928-G07]